MKYCMMGVLALLNVSCASWADEPVSREVIVADTSALVSKFDVNNQKVSVKQGDIEFAKKDNSDLLSALSSMGVELIGLNYSTDVYVKHYTNIKSVHEDHLIGYFYRITLDKVDSLENDKLSALKAKDYLVNSLPASKAPVVCYSFLGTDNLNVFCHLGTKERPELPAIINGLKVAP